MGLQRNNGKRKRLRTKLLEFDLQAEDKIIAGLLYPEMEQPLESVLGMVKGFSAEQKEQVLKSALEGRVYKYYKAPRAFETRF